MSKSRKPGTYGKTAQNPLQAEISDLDLGRLCGMFLPHFQMFSDVSSCLPLFCAAKKEETRCLTQSLQHS